MGDYSDYSMMSPGGGDVVTGICHARGSNAELRGGWLICITVADIQASAAACLANDGTVLIGPRGLADGQFGVIEDPSGATASLCQP
jgi:predicted enzyme related to lactoylglutathione lyase